jgi:hypothetical protein
VYFSPAIFRKAKPEKEYILGAQVIWAEYDGNAPDEWTEAPDGSADGAHTAVPGPPSLRVQSSTDTHQHCYWKLEELSTDVEFIERVNRAIAYETKSDTSGWDANQVLRPPHTINYKHDLEVTVVEENDREYHNKHFSHIKSFKELVDTNIDINELPPVQELIGKYQWEADTLNLLLKDADNIPTGMRSSALMRIGFHCAELGMSDSEAYAILIWADDKWGKFKGRSDRKKRLIDIINRARQKHPRATETVTFAGLVSPDTKIETDTRIVYGFQDLLKAEIRIEWAIKDLMPRAGLGIIGSASGVGKTQLSLNMAIRCALSRDFLGWSPIGRQKLLFLELEMNAGSFKHFISNMAQAYSPEDLETLQRNLLLAPINEPIPLHHPTGRQFIEELIVKYQPDGIVIDSLGKIHLGNLNDDELIRKTMIYINYLRSKFGVYVWIIHHNRKAQEGNKRPRKLEDLYGNQYLTTDLDIAISLWKEEDGRLELRQVKNRLAEEVPPFSIRRVEHLQFIRDDTAMPEGIMNGLQKGITPPKDEPPNGGIPHFDLGVG